MKIALFRLVTVILLFSFASCKKELSNEEGNPPSSGDFYATIDGTLWNADSLKIAFANNGEISINGLSKSGIQISMVLTPFSTGIFTLSASSDSYAFYTDNSLSTPVTYYSSNGTAGGTVTISKIDTINHLINGTFSFTLVNSDDNTSKSVTQGVFYYVPYSGTSSVVLPGGNEADTLKAIINSNPFTSAQIVAQPANGQLVISGVSADGTQYLDLLMPENITIGTYNMDLSGSNTTYGGVYFTNPNNPLISQANGTLTITSNNTTTNRITGSFSFNASSLTDAESATVTNGYFSVNY